MDTTVYGPVGPEVGHTALIGALTARTMLPHDLTAGRLSIVEHSLEPKELGAPLHRHSREDEYTVVVEGRIGVLLGEDVYEAGPGELVLKPRPGPGTVAGDHLPGRIRAVLPGHRPVLPPGC